MATFNLPAKVRTGTGKGNNRKLRATGQIPASVYRNGDTPDLISIDPTELNKGFKKTNNPNTLVSLQYEGAEKLCLVKEVQRHPASGALIHIDFYALEPDQKINISVPVKISGDAIGVKLGGKLRLIQRYLDVKCSPADIPAYVHVDVTELDFGNFIRVSDIDQPTNCELIYPSDFNVLTVTSKRGLEEELEPTQDIGAEEGPIEETTEEE